MCRGRVSRWSLVCGKTTRKSRCCPLQPDESGVVQRRQRDASVHNISAPMGIISYNKWMGGVDRGDQLRQYYHLRLKSRKFYKYLFCFLVDVSITNSYVLHRGANSAHLKHFRLELARGLIGSYCSQKRAAPSAMPLVIRRPRQSTLLHFPVKKSTGSRKGVSRCWYCAYKRQPPARRETLWYCEECQLYLCHTGMQHTDCFRAHHTSLL